MELCTVKYKQLTVPTALDNLYVTILGILSTLFGGLNIFQFLFYRSEKKKSEAEAESANIDAKQKNIDLQQDQFDYLLDKLTKYQNDYFELAEKLQEEANRHATEMQETTQRFTSIINEKCNEIAELKSKIIYFKNLRCYNTNCPHRMSQNPKDFIKENNEVS